MSWYLAPSLATLRAEINTRWPGRDRASDGSIGDAAHQASTSDHNPNARGSVDAIDVDEDGIDPYAVIAAFERHPSAHYWIYERQIADRDDGWRRRPYYGSNPHDEHAHFSIRQSATAEQDTRPWGLLEDDMTAEQVWTEPLPLPGRVADRLVAKGWSPTMSPWEALARVVESVIIPRDLVDEQEVAAALAPLLTAAPVPVVVDQLVAAGIAQAVADQLAARLQE